MRELSFADLRALLGAAQDGRAIQLVNVAPDVLFRVQDSGASAVLDANPVPTPTTLDGWHKTGKEASLHPVQQEGLWIGA